MNGKQEREVQSCALSELVAKIPSSSAETGSGSPSVTIGVAIVGNSDLQSEAFSAGGGRRLKFSLFFMHHAPS